MKEFRGGFMALDVVSLKFIRPDVEVAALVLCNLTIPQSMISC